MSYIIICDIIIYKFLGNKIMERFVSSIIYSLILTLLSLAVIFFLQAPLISFVYYGFFADIDMISFINNIIEKNPNKEPITIVAIIMQVALTIGFAAALFVFIKNVIHVFLKNEKLIRPYYVVFFFMTTVVPVIIIFLSIFLKVKLIFLLVLVEGVFTILNIVLIIFSKKILPDTTDSEHRKYLFQ